METITAKIANVSRHRLAIDGEGVTTLVTFAGCPLRCRYCLNPHTLSPDPRFKDYTPEQLYEQASIDSLYFVATGGGVTFGGGEPCLHPAFIRRFRDLCGAEWKLRVESSLNVPAANILSLLDVIDQFIIDIKDMNADKYRHYTLKDNSRVTENLNLLAAAGLCEKCLIRLPLIPDFNTEADRQLSRERLMKLGFNNFDCFNYKIKENKLWHEANKPVES